MSVFILEYSDFWSSKILGGGGGSDLNVQLTLSGEKVNMSTALAGVTTIISLILFSPGGNGNEKP